MASLFALLAVLGSASASVVPSSSNPNTLLISSTAPSAQLAQCLKSSYYGTYGGQASAQEHIYLPSEECLLGESALDGLSAGSLIPLNFDTSDEAGRIVWVGQAGVDPESLPSDSSGDVWSIISSTSREFALLSSPDSYQQVLSSKTSKVSSEPIRLLHQTPTSLLLHVPRSYLSMIDTFLPSHLVPVALPSQPLPALANGWEPVPSQFARHLANVTKHLRFSPEIDKIVSEGIELNQIRRDVRWLTGEAPSGIVSRHSFTPGAIKAAHWIKDKVEATGANCTLHTFIEGFSPNVICHYPSSLNSTEHVILSAHYDSRGSFGSTRAPGGDDDGSGTGHLLGVAHAIGAQGVKFKKQVVLAFFAGEEQGLLGSHAYAEHLHEKNTTILLQVQADMLAYHAPGEPLQIGLPESIHLPEASHLIGNLSQIYSPELVVGKTAACCSDHQSFISYGFPATQVFERNGWIADPYYHNSGDLSQRDNYDFEQVVSIAKVTLAGLLTVAGYNLEEGV
ncbi:aminopeptidase [Kwoniella mangroviensis CBS 8886]|uniref:uncharacterized protein n=1 Tax=Kwoniella mangroviensis CBS 8507 TaxID=1296122 RepID=UPI00080D2767|nr:aminopeptidase [Kwoniella mangroviensis CBS 8507]OCF64693.1 aminopeptidase [Kwoniella mangroviensis CBS 8507]OCF74635.1 aminopeptidase [Kwoniella mangroviensis CBS 8886]